MTATRRGRISQATYVRVVGRMINKDWFALARCETLTQLEVIDQLVAAYPKAFFSPGCAVRALIDKSIDHVVRAARLRTDDRSQKMADYLEKRRAGVSVAAIAQGFGLSREYVTRTIGQQALTQVTERLLALGKHQLQSEQTEEGITKINARNVS